MHDDDNDDGAKNQNKTKQMCRWFEWNVEPAILARLDIYVRVVCFTCRMTFDWFNYLPIWDILTYDFSLLRIIWLLFHSISDPTYYVHYFVCVITATNRYEATCSLFTFIYIFLFWQIADWLKRARMCPQQRRWWWRLHEIRFSYLLIYDVRVENW